MVNTKQSASHVLYLLQDSRCVVLKTRWVGSVAIVKDNCKTKNKHCGLRAIMRNPRPWKKQVNLLSRLKFCSSAKSKQTLTNGRGSVEKSKNSILLFYFAIKFVGRQCGSLKVRTVIMPSSSKVERQERKRKRHFNVLIRSLAKRTRDQSGPEQEPEANTVSDDRSISDGEGRHQGATTESVQPTATKENEEETVAVPGPSREAVTEGTSQRENQFETEVGVTVSNK